MKEIIGLVLLLSITSFVSCQYFTSTAPTWTIDPTFQAGSANLIFVAPVSAPHNQGYLVTFFNTTATNPPIFFFGLKTYRGNDYLVQENFNLTAQAVTTTGATVGVDLANITTVLYLSISFIVAEQTISYNIHFLTGVDLNYSSPLANISTMSSSLTSHTQIIDFTTSQVYNSYNFNYQSFTTPLTNNKILFFITNLYMVATSTVPLTMDISYTILDAGSYSMTLTVGYNVSIHRISFNQIFYDAGDYVLGSSPYLNAFVWDVTNALATDNIITVESLILNNQFVIGLATFNTATGQATLDIQLVFATYASGYGAKLNPSIPTNTSLTGISSCKISTFYMMTYTCHVSYPYLNLTSLQCQDACGFYSFVNTTDNTCGTCTNTICLACNQTDPSTCTVCPLNYQLANSTCQCDTSTGYFYLVDNLTCFSCGDIVPYCTTCSYTGVSSAAYDSGLFVCIGCNNTAGYFIDPSDLCSQCTLSNCITCSGLSQCSVCDNGYGLTASGLCSTCPVTSCLTCLNLTYCSVCSGGITPTNGTCQTCSQTCTCDGYILPYLANGDCSAICGDGIIIFPNEECDDGNTLSGDGCSSSCVIEAYSTCGGTPSQCFLNQNIAVSLVSTVVSEENCNQISFQFEVIPNLLIFQVYPTDWTSFLTSNNSALTYVPGSLSQKNGLLSITYSYSQTIQNQPLYFTVNPVGLVNSTYLSTVSASSFAFNVQPTNNLAAVYCDKSICHLRQTTPSYMTFQSAVAYLGLAFSLFSLKIAGLEMFGLVQLSYFIMCDYDYVNPLMLGVLDRKEVNGINVDDGENGSPQTSARVRLNGITSERFLSDFNVMFYIMIAIFLVGLALYTISYLINKYLEDKSPQNQHEQSLRSQSLASQPSHNGSVKTTSATSRSRASTIHKISKYLLKQVLVTFLIFNLFNLSFSAGLQILYIYNVQVWDILCLLLAFALTLGVVISQFFVDREQFGEYQNRFKNQTLPHNYVTALIMFRFTLGILMALLNEWNNSGIIFVLLGMAFLGFVFAFEPFIDPKHNIRSKIVHSVYLLVLVVNYFYRKETAYNEISANQFILPAYVQLITVGITIILSTIFLGYELFKAIRQKFCKKPSQPSNEQLQNGDSQIMQQKQQNKEKQIAEIEVQNLDS